MSSRPRITLSEKDWDEIIQQNLFPYIEALTGTTDGAEAKVHWQAFDDAYKEGDTRYRPTLTRCVFGSYRELKRSLHELNRAGAGIFVAVNETDGKRRTIKTIKKVRAVWAEFDGPQIDIAELPLLPSIVVQSHHGPHLYWKVIGEVSTDECRAMVKTIAAQLKGDPKVHNPDRVLRAPGFFHQKNPESPFLVLLRKAEDLRYTLQEVQTAFPSKASGSDNKDNSEPDKPPRDHQPGRDSPPRSNIHLDERIAQATAYVANIPGAIEPNRHTAMFKVASVLALGFDLPDSNALPIFHDFARRCSPSVDPTECAPLLTQARRYGSEAIGGKVREPLPNIEITTDEKGVSDRAIKALVKIGGVFHRGQRLVHIVTEGRPSSFLQRPLGAPFIAPMHVHHLRERIAAAAKFYRRVTKRNPSDPHAPSSDMVPAHVPTWCPNAIHARASWPEFPYLQGVVTTPILRADGSIYDRPGYDSLTGMSFHPLSVFPAIVENPSESDARKAFESLREVITDFPFAKEIHAAANLAAILTPFVRSAMSGPSPLFLFDANVRGAGKTLGADTIGIIATGRPLARMPQAPSDEEEEKRLAGIAQDGDPIVLIDNINRPLGSGALDAILTSTRWKPRILGKTGNPEFEIKTTFLATGNNVQLAGDTPRRTLHIRLCSPNDHPEDRKDFLHSPLLPWVKENHPRLAVAALTVIRAYVVAGRPCRNIRPWGSFEEWSLWVREPIMWLMGVDPMDTREELESHADIEKEALLRLVDGWRRIFMDGTAHTVRELLDELNRSHSLEPALREALCALCPPKPGYQLPEVRALGNKFKMLRERPIGDWCFIPMKSTASGLPWLLSLTDRTKIPTSW